MSYQDLPWQYYSSLKTYSTEITANLKSLISLNEIEPLDETRMQEKNRLKKQITRAIFNERNILNNIKSSGNPATILSSFINKLEQDSSISPDVKLRLHYRLSSTMKATTNIQVKELGIFDPSDFTNIISPSAWQYSSFTLDEIITAHIFINLTSKLKQRIKKRALLGEDVIPLPSKTTEALDTMLKDTELNTIISSPCYELLYALYGNNIDTQIFSEIDATFIRSPLRKQAVNDGFKKFISTINTGLLDNCNTTGEITFGDTAQDIMQLLIKLILLEVLIPYMSDETLKHFNNQISWGINIMGEKYYKTAITSEFENELEERKITPTSPHH